VTISSAISVVNLDTWLEIVQKKELITLTEELLAKEALHAMTSSVSSVDNLDIWHAIAQKKELIILTEELLVREIQLMTILSATSVVSQVIWHAIVQTLLMRRVWQGFNAIDVGKMDTFPKIVLIKTLMKQMADNVIGAASQAI